MSLQLAQERVPGGHPSCRSRLREKKNWSRAAAAAARLTNHQAHLHQKHQNSTRTKEHRLDGALVQAWDNDAVGSSTKRWGEGVGMERGSTVWGVSEVGHHLISTGGQVMAPHPLLERGSGDQAISSVSLCNAKVSLVDLRFMGGVMNVLPRRLGA
jgi:hypothetical protein